MPERDHPPTTLIATVGKSPGAVTGVYRALVEPDPALRPDAMLLITTEGDPEIDQSLGLIRRAMYQGHQVQLDEVDIYRIPYMDISSDHAARTFQKLVADAVEQRIAMGHRVALNITGGRASMGAMLALAGHLYYDSVDATYHLQVTADVEKLGTLEELEKNQGGGTEQQKSRFLRGMFPGPQDYQLVPLPRFDLSYTCRWLQEVSSLEAALLAREARADAVEDAYLKLANGVLEGLPGRVGLGEAFEMRNIVRSIVAEECDPQDKLPAIAAILQRVGLVETQAEVAAWFENLPEVDPQGPEFTTAWLTWLMEKSTASQTPFLERLFTRDQEKLREKLEVARLRVEIFRTYAEGIGGTTLKYASLVAIFAMAWQFQILPPPELITSYLR